MRVDVGDGAVSTSVDTGMALAISKPKNNGATNIVTASANHPGRMWLCERAIILPSPGIGRYLHCTSLTHIPSDCWNPRAHHSRAVRLDGQLNSGHYVVDHDAYPWDAPRRSVACKHLDVPLDSFLLRMAIPVLACIVAGTAGYPYWATHPLLGAFCVVMCGLLATIGVTYAASKTGRKMGLFFIAAAFLQALTWLAAYDRSFGPFVSEGAQALFFVTLGVGGMLFEQETLGTWVARAWVAQCIITLSSDQTLIFLLTEPNQIGYSADSSWPTQVHLSDNGVSHLFVYLNATYLFLAATLVVALYVRWRQFKSVDRPLAAPLLVAASFMAVVSALVQTISTQNSLETVMTVHIVEAAAATAFPVSLFASGTWRRWRELSVRDRVARDCRTDSFEHIETALRKALADDRLALWIWIPERALYLDSGGSLATAEHLNQQIGTDQQGTSLNRPDQDPGGVGPHFGYLGPAT